MSKAVGRTYKAQRVSSELLALREKDGAIRPKRVIDWARKHPRSTLHAELEWDDEVAGERYRLQQVRMLIAVHVVDPEGYRRFVSLSIDRISGGGYRPLDQVMSQPNLREIMLTDAFEDLNRVQKKYERLQELSVVWAAKDRVIARRARRKRKEPAD